MGAKILLVEDNDALAYGLVYALGRADCDTLHAATIAAAEELLLANRFDLILLDVMLPDGNGYDLLTRIRETSPTPVIFLTACDDEVNIISGFELGADDYITKPFRVQELILRVKAVLRRCATPIPDAGLTNIEAKLLEILRSSGGKTLHRSQILNMLWDNKGEFVDNNTLSVHIKRLRDKVGAEHITTVRGVGYKWTD